jgi:hypothetical protein
MSPSTFPAQIILGSLITGGYDVNRNEILPPDDFSLVQKWAESIQKAGLQGILFHNGFSPETCEKHQNQHLQFVHVEPSPVFNPNVYRYFLYLDFLQKNANKISDVFVTDVSDVVLIQNPFSAPEYLSSPAHIFCGDELKTLQNDWMQAHSAHFRTQIADFGQYEIEFAEETLLNCGVIGGQARVMLDFLTHLTALHTTYNQSNPTAYTGDMGAFNYLIRTQFAPKILHGFPVNTVFKAYEESRKDCWFRHK